MKDARRIATIACVMLVTLRLMIGWQLLYEGLWKVKTLKSPKPWTAAGYLKNSQGPFRPIFRDMAGDPDELDWLNVKSVSADWDDWQQRFVKHYRLSNGQKAKLDQWVNGHKDFKVEVPSIPNDYNSNVFSFVLDREVKDATEITGSDSGGKTLAFEVGKVKVRVDGRGVKSFEATDSSKVVLKADPKKPFKKGAKVDVFAGKRLMEIGLDEVVSFLGTGSQVSSVEIVGAEQDVKTLADVKESIAEIKRNIGRVKFSRHTDDKSPRTLTIKVDKKGKVTAADISVDDAFKVVNKDQVICTLNKPVKLECKIQVRAVDYLVVDGKRHLTTAEREKLIAALDEDGHGDLAEPVRQVYKKAKDGISFKERLSATIRGNPDWVSSEKLQRVGEIEKYKLMLAAYEKDLAMANQDYRWDHLAHTWGEIQTLRGSLVGPVKALDAELKDQAEEMLSIKQLARGPVGQPWTSQRISDLMTIAGLTILGACLILGLCTRFSAIMAAFMLFMFYAAMPPWPGVPEMPGPEHSFIVNKNFIEVVALLALACLPSGRWFGLDGMIGRWLGKRKLARMDTAK